MKKLVLINVAFRDVYTGKIHAAGSKVEMTEERVAEIKAFNPEFVSVIGNVEEKPDEEKQEKPDEKPKGKKKPE